MDGMRVQPYEIGTIYSNYIYLGTLPPGRHWGRDLLWYLWPAFVDIDSMTTAQTNKEQVID